MEVLFPPSFPGQQYYADMQKYVINNASAPVTGANFAVQWADIDQGPLVNPRYDWSSVEHSIGPWAAAGKKVNLILWAVSDSPTNTATPLFVWANLGAAEIALCDGEQIPDYFDATNFQTPYLAFIQAALQKYGSDSRIGYIRIGLGRGGETFPGQGFNGTDGGCTNTIVNVWGYTDQKWITYLTNMMTSASAANTAKKQLMVGLVGGAAGGSGSAQGVADQVAAAAVSVGIGFGSQGLQAADIPNYPNCTSDWCNLFNQYSGQVPLELQTVGLSCPAGVGKCPGDANQNDTGSLVPLLPFAASHKVNILEVYFQDWLLAYDPNYPGFGQYGAAYATAIQSAASGQ